MSLEFSDLLNQTNVSADIINVTTISTDNLTLTNVDANNFIGSDSNNNISTRYIYGTSNMVNVTNNSNNIVLSLPQAIATTSDVSFNHLNVGDVSANNIDVSGFIIITGGTTNSIIGTDINKKIVAKTLSGTTNQITISNVGDNYTFSTPQNIHTAATPTFGAMTINGTITQNNNNKGFVIGDLPGAAPGYASICHQALSASALNSCLIQNSGGDVNFNAPNGKILVFTQGGTHRLRIWNNQPPWGYNGQIEVVSADDYISSSNSALRVNGGLYCGKKLQCDSTGTFASGVNTNSIESIGSTLNIASANTTQYINIGSGSGLQAVNIGSSGSGTTTINIGAGGDIVNIAGSLNYISANNLDISDNIITINKGSSGSGTARGAGINIRDNSVDNQGYITVSNTGNSFTLKAPENNFILSTPILTSNSTVVTTTEPQTIGGYKTFTGNIMINPTAGGADINIRAAEQAGFNIYSFSAVDGLGVWSQTLNAPIFKIKNALTTNRILTTDEDNYLASADFGASEIVRTTTNQTISGVKTFSGTLNMSSLTASQHLALDASKNIITVTDPATNLLSTNNTWTGTNTFSNTLNISTSKDKFNTTRIPLLTDGTKIYRSEFDDGQFVMSVGNQPISGTKTFITNPVISPSAGKGALTIRASGQSGFEIVTFSNADGIAIWNLATGGPILQLKYFLTPNRLLTTDGDNFLASAAFGPSEIVRTTTNQTISGEKTFSTGIRLPTVGGTASLLDFYEDLTIQMQFTGPFLSNQFRDVYLCRVGRCVTLTVQSIISNGFSPGGSVINTTGVVIPSRFLGATKNIGTFRATHIVGNTCPAYCTIFDTGAIQISLIPGNSFSGSFIGIEMFSGSWTV